MPDRILTCTEIRSAVIPLLKKYKAKKAILFGSYARNEADCHSDIDLRRRAFCANGYFLHRR